MKKIINKDEWIQSIKSNAISLPNGIFTWKDPVKIAKELKKAVESSTNTKGTKFSSAMSMINFYINRAGSKLDQTQKQILNKAKDELRIIYKKPNLKVTKKV